MEKIRFFFVTLFFILAFAFQAWAQVSQSNCVITKVGAPSTTPPICDIGLGGSTDTIQAAQLIKAAYDFCGQPPGYTHDHPLLGTCMANFLRPYNYSGIQLQAFETRRRSSLVAPPANSPPANKSKKCSQCVGYVASTIAMVEVDTTVLSVARAKDVNNLPGGFRAGSGFYARVGVGNSVGVQPGDVAVSSLGQSGHILFVKEARGNVGFVGLESNYSLDCKVTDSKTHLKASYTYYRRG